MANLRRRLTLHIRKAVLDALDGAPVIQNVAASLVDLDFCIEEMEHASVVMLQEDPFTTISIAINRHSGGMIRGIGFSKCARYEGHMADKWSPEIGKDYATSRAARQLADRLVDGMGHNTDLDDFQARILDTISIPGEPIQ